jgi:hypothetical protein
MMRDGDDNDGLRLHGIDDRERKAMEDTNAQVFAAGPGRPRLRQLGDELRGVANERRESVATSASRAAYQSIAARNSASAAGWNR